MRRALRSAHRSLWPILALAIVAGFTAALCFRAPPPI
jgi:hypothetical protein